MTARREVAGEQRRAFERQVLDGQFHVFAKGQASVAVSIIPLFPPSPLLDIERVQQEQGTQLPPMGATGGSCEPLSRSFFNHSSTRQRGDMADSVVEFSEDGTVLSASKLHSVEAVGSPKGFHFARYEQQAVTFIGRCVSFQRRHGVSGPLLVGVSLTGVKGLPIIPPDHFYNPVTLRPIKKDILGGEAVTLDASITGDREGDSTAITKAIQPGLKKYVWREAGLNVDPAIDDNGNFRQLR